MTIFGYDLPALGEIGTFLTGTAAAYGAWQAWKARRAAATAAAKVIELAAGVITVVAKIDEVQKQTNGMSHAMQEIARKEGRQEKADEIIAEAAVANEVKRDEAMKDAQSAADISEVTPSTPNRRLK